ncbi:MAG TPA: hypothetical protein VEG44_03565 [Candidatus Acidoferrales bacterium]|nr:hypothetical protein [Candidatus Acidoferrales bacterium]
MGLTIHRPRLSNEKLELDNTRARRHSIPLTLSVKARTASAFNFYSGAASHFVLGDLRKFAEQYGDIIRWNESNRAYILTHGVSGGEWAHYRHPLPEYVYTIYMKHWSDVCFIQ